MSQLELLRAYKEKFNVYVKTAEPHQYVKLMILDMMLQKQYKMLKVENY